MSALITLFLSPVGKYIAGFLAVVIIIAGAGLAFERWLAGHDARVLEVYMSLVEQQTAKAKEAEEKRQAEAVSAAVAAYQRRLVEAQASQAQSTIETEQRITEYEKRLAAANRRCDLTDDDIGVIVHDGAGKADPIGKRKGPN
jgi:hypothetical protein